MQATNNSKTTNKPIIMDFYNDLNANFKYMIANEKDHRFGVVINSVGFQAIHPGTTYPPSEHPSHHYFNASKGRILQEYQLVYITKGKGIFFSDENTKIEIERGDLLLLHPGQWHTYFPSPETGWNEYYIGFEGSIIENLIQTSFLSDRNTCIKVGLSESLVQLFGQSINIAQADKASVQQYLGGVLMHIIGLTFSILSNRQFEVNNMDQKIESAKIFMYENIYGDVDVEKLAERLNLSYSWFRKIFKDYTGYAPAKYFQELKIQKAKEMLAHTSMSIKEISFTLGYTTSEHFFSLFKRNVGMTPSEYRNYNEIPQNKENNQTSQTPQKTK